MKPLSLRIALVQSAIFGLSLVSLPLVAQDKGASKPTTEKKTTEKETEKATKWKSLIKSDSLEGWEVTNFGGEGDVEVKDGSLILDMGDPLTGVTSKQKDFPKSNYEMRWKARRIDGSDFFAGITFPIGDEHCSFIAGGWGGGLTGISSINGNDAAENETTGFKEFKNGKWYSFRVRVDKTHVKVWLDDEELISVEREGKKFTLRAEVYKCRPVGYCVFQSKCEIKEWEYQVLE
jgi:hypothetical protein